jgi:parvulin-like peptidyl-prolyl isomerase
MAEIPFSLEQLRWLASSQQLTAVVRASILDQVLSKIHLEEEDKQGALRSFCDEKGLHNSEEIKDFLYHNLLSAADFQLLVQRPLRLHRLCEHEYLHKAEARFLERKASLDRIVYSLVRVGDPGLARELFLRIEAKEADFATLATEFSQGPERGTRGVVGPVPMLQAHPELAQRLRTSSPGLLLEPFQIEQWWLVVRVESYTPATLDDATRLSLAKELFDEWLQAEVGRQLSKLAPQLLAIDPGSDTP